MPGRAVARVQAELHTSWHTGDVHGLCTSDLHGRRPENLNSHCLERFIYVSYGSALALTKLKT
jgi:hypothetical protein